MSVRKHSLTHDFVGKKRLISENLNLRAHYLEALATDSIDSI